MPRLPAFPSPSVVLAASTTATLVVLCGSLVFADDLREFFKETGGVERMSALLLGACVLAWFWSRGPRQALAGWHVPAACALMTMRELDFDKRFTEQGVLKLRYYTEPGPFLDKLPGVLLILVILAVVATFVRRDLRPWLARLGRLDRTAWLLAVALIVAAVAKSVDGIDRKLAPFGIEVPPLVLARAGRIEELLELAFALLLLQAIALTRPKG